MKRSRSFLLFFIMISLSCHSFGQSTMKVKMYAQEAAESLMKKISPNTGKNATYEIFDADYDSYKGEYTIEMSAKWQGSPCMLCDETTFEIKGFLTVKNDGSNPRFKQTYKNSAVERSETWSKVGNGLIVLANAIDEQNRQYEQSQTTQSYSNPNKSYSSGGTSSYSNMNYGSFIDTRDSKTYKTINIGNQIWLAENLSYKPNYGNYWSYNNENTNLNKYGYLYDWSTAKNVCPSGWHLPSDAEWTELVNYLGGFDIAGTKMKSISGWDDNNGNNSSGFLGFPGGYRNGGYFNSIGKNAYWWSSTEEEYNSAFLYSLTGLDYVFSKVYRQSLGKGDGMYVRCLKNK